MVEQNNKTILSIIGIISILLLGIPLTSATTDIEHWFNNTLVGTGNTWVLSGGSTTYTNGYDDTPNTALLMNQSNYYTSNVAYTEIDAGEDYFSELVFRCYGTSGTTRDLQRFDYGNNGIIFYILNNDSLRVFNRDGDGDSVVYNGAENITDGKWHHVVTQRINAANEIYTYVDGVFKHSGGQPSPAAVQFTTAGSVQISRASYTAGGCSIGYLRVGSNEYLSLGTIENRSHYFVGSPIDTTYYAYSEQTGQPLNNFNVTFTNTTNTYNYTTTTGYVTTELSGEYNISINALGFTSVNYYNNTLNGGEINQSMNATNYTTTFNAYELNSTNIIPYNITVTQGNYSQTYNNTPSYRNITISLWGGPYTILWQATRFNNHTQTIYTSTPTSYTHYFSDSSLNITMEDGYGNTINNFTIQIDFWDRSTQYTNTTTTGYLTYDTILGENVTVTVNSPSTHQGIINNTLITNEQTNITLFPPRLLIYFYQNSAPTTTSGSVEDLETSKGFNNSYIIYIQSNLTEGLVQVKFNTINNWTQYYEYINDQETYINESIEIINTSNELWYGYFEVLDYSNSPIDDVVIRAEYTIAEVNQNKTAKLLGQRLTDDEGITFFIAEKLSQVRFSFIKEGYDIVEEVYSFGDEEFDRTNPRTIYLQQSSSGVTENAWVYLPREITDRTKNIYGALVAKGRTAATVQTNYRNSQEQGPKNVYDATAYNGRYYFTLYPNIDYNGSGTDDISVWIYLNGQLWKNITILYYDTTPQEVFPDNDSLKNGTAAVIQVIGLLAFIIILNLLFQESRAGFHGYMGGCLILAVINPTYFAWLALTSGVYYTSLIIKRSWNE